MDIRGVRSGLVKGLSPRLEELGYGVIRPKSNYPTFRKELDGNRALAIDLDVTKHKASGRFNAAFVVGFRIDELQDVYEDFLPDANEERYEPRLSFATRWNNIERIEDAHDYRDCEDEAAVLAYAQWLVDRLEAVVFPFLERFSDRSTLISNLRAPDFRDWIPGIPRGRRFMLLLSDARLRDARDDFDEVAGAWREANEAGTPGRSVADAVIDGVQGRWEQG